MRYKNTQIKRDKDGKRYYRPTIVPNIPLRDSDLFIYPKVGERLDLLAHKFYGDQSLWYVIARANSPFRGRFKFESGTKLIIPTDLSEFFTELNILNSRFESPDPK